jgi:hypothetical protein
MTLLSVCDPKQSRRSAARDGLMGRVDASLVRPDPFPYIVVRNALDDDRYQALATGLPGLDRLREEHRAANNRRVDLVSSSGRAELGIDDVPNVWGRFLREHASDEFVAEVISLFAAHIPRCAPRLYQEILAPAWKRSLYEPREPDGGRRFARLGPLTRLGRTQWLNDFSRPHCLDVQGRATLALNTPVRQVTSVRGPHVDSPHKAYVGLYYLRHPDDRSTGGALELFRWKPGRVRKPWASKIAADDVEIVETVPYEANTFALFLNTSDSIHGVSVRSETDVPRYLVVTSGWFASAPARAIGASNNGAGKGVYDD